MALQELCFDVLLEKCAAPDETTALEIQQRVASALASNTAQGERFLTGLAAGFVPGGRINSAAGTSRLSTLINCFVQPVADTMTGCIEGVPGTMSALANAVTTMRLGGGVGYDFTPLRPMGAKVKDTDSRASGPVSFMRMFDRACETVESAGARRGAQMGVLRVDHPDIEVFIDAKKTPNFETMGLDPKQSAVLKSLMQDKPSFGWGVRQAFATLSNFNISVAVTEEFMKAVIDDAMFDLIHEARPDYEAATKQCPDGKVNALYSKREPKTGPMGALGWHVDISNPVTGDDFLLHTKELILPNGQIRPYSVWLSGQYPKVLDGLMKTLSIDMRISDPAWVAMKLSKLTSFGELRGDFLAQVPGEGRQQSYPSTVAYVAVVLLARIKALGLINGGTTLKKAVAVAVEVEPPVFKAAGRQCPSCMSMSLHKRDGCDICENCGHTGSCG